MSIFDHRAIEAARSPELALDDRTHLVSPVGPLALPPADGQTTPAGSGPVPHAGVIELPDPVGDLFTQAPGLAAIAWRRAEHFARGYDAAHDDAQGHDKRKFSLFNLTRQRLADTADFIADGKLDAGHADAYRIGLIYAGALIAAELDRHDREMKRLSQGEQQP